MKAYALEGVASWHPALVETIRRRDTATVQPLTLRSCVPAWEPSDVTVVGDAVHAMSPALGIGVYGEARRTYDYRTLRMSAAVGEKVIGHLPLPE